MDNSGKKNTATRKEVIVGVCVMTLVLQSCALGFTSKEAQSTEKVCVKMLWILR